MIPKKPPQLSTQDKLELPKQQPSTPLSPTFSSLKINLNLCNVKRGQTVFNLFNENCVHVAERFENTCSESKTPTNTKLKSKMGFEQASKSRLFTT